MSFWKSELGKITGEAADAFAKEFVLIPNDTLVLAKIESFMNCEHSGFKYLLIEWMLTEGDFKNRKVQQKLKVFGGGNQDRDPAKVKHRALNMLKLIYNMFNVKPSHGGEPTDNDLSVFVGKVAGIKIRETEPNADGKQYNWVSEVHPAHGFKSETGIKLVTTTVVKHGNAVDTAFSRYQESQELENDVPF